MMIALALVCYLSVASFLGYRAYKGPASHSTKDFLAHGRLSGTRTLVINAGDSLTQGTFSADYVSLLRDHLQPTGFEFVNAGVNGAKVADLLQRTSDIVACRPDAVTVLIGTNDVRADLNVQIGRPSISSTASLAAFRYNLESLIRDLHSVANPKLAIISIPPIGQNLLSPANHSIEQYNAIIQEVCERHHATYLPLYEHACAQIAAFPHNRRSADGPLHELSRNVAIRHFFLLQTWDQISDNNGFVIHTDAIHLNRRGARLISDLVEAWLRKETERHAF